MTTTTTTFSVADCHRDSEIIHNTYSSQDAIEQRWNVLSDFVNTVCAGRSYTHGHAHMMAVAEMTRFIIQQDFHDESGHLTLDAITVAWLHDVADHKYDYDGTLEQKLDEFGTDNIWNYEEIKKVIKYVSYSTEHKAILAGTPLDFPLILGAYYSQIRDIVSDADKLESIGVKGLERSFAYNRETNPTFTHAQVIAEVRKIYDEKLIKLASQFIKTPTARAFARISNKEMEEWLELTQHEQ